MDINNPTRKLRIKYGLTQRQLANEIGCTVQLISNYECGRVMPSLKIIVKMAKVFKMKTEDLVKVIGY